MPVLARMDPETAHTAAVYIASKGLAPREHGEDPSILVRFANDVILRIVMTCDDTLCRPQLYGAENSATL